MSICRVDRLAFALPQSAAWRHHICVRGSQLNRPRRYWHSPNRIVELRGSPVAGIYVSIGAAASALIYPAVAQRHRMPA